MTEATKKSFAEIRDDYAFFTAHTTEFDQDLSHYQQVLAQWVPPEPTLQFLDFGCGTGTFTSRFLRLVHPLARQFRITLIEPDDISRQHAIDLLTPLSQFPVQHFPYFSPEITTRFHLILCNHVLYYVPDLRQTVTWLLQRRHPQGLLLMTMAGRENIISQFWRVCFDYLGHNIPYYLAEDLTPLLQELHPNYQRQTVTYTLRFPDTLENRWKLLRFMLGQYVHQLKAYDLPDLFDPYAKQGQIDITTYHYQFQVS